MKTFASLRAIAFAVLAASMTFACAAPLQGAKAFESQTGVVNQDETAGNSVSDAKPSDASPRGEGHFLHHRHEIGLDRFISANERGVR